MLAKSRLQFLTVLIATVIPVTITSSAQADITWSGDIEPADPTTWTSSNTTFPNRTYIGKTVDGTLTVDSDSDLQSEDNYIGYGSDAIGEVTVGGTGSTWSISGFIYVAYEGRGTLNITGGGVVSNSRGRIGHEPG